MGFISKIFSGIKKIVKGVAKGIKKVVKGVAKVVKKVAKSKIFKAVMMAAAMYVTVGAAAGAFGASGTGFFGSWAASSAAITGGTSALGVFGKVFMPAKWLGTGLGKTARGVSDLAGWTTKGAELGASGITGGSTVTEISGTMPSTMAPTAAQQANIAQQATAAQQAITAGSAYYDPVNQVYIDQTTGKAVTGEWWKQRAADIAKEQGIGPTATATATGAGKTAQRFINWSQVGTNVLSSAGGSYVQGLIEGDEDYPGSVVGGDEEFGLGKDDLMVFNQKADARIMKDIYGTLAWGNADPGYMPLYTQATV